MMRDAFAMTSEEDFEHFRDMLNDSEAYDHLWNTVTEEYPTFSASELAGMLDSIRHEIEFRTEGDFGGGRVGGF